MTSQEERHVAASSTQGHYSITEVKNIDSDEEVTMQHGGQHFLLSVKS